MPRAYGSGIHKNPVGMGYIVTTDFNPWKIEHLIIIPIFVIY